MSTRATLLAALALGAGFPACAPVVASMPAVAPFGVLRLELRPPEPAGLSLRVRDEAGRPATPRLSAPAPGRLEATLPAPGTYTVEVTRDGQALTALGPLTLAAGQTTVAEVSLAGASPVVAPPRLVLGDFSAAAWSGWQNATYFPWSRKNDYRRGLGPDGEAIAHVISDRAGSMLVRSVQGDLGRTPIARWRWKVPGPVAGADERANDTDDAPARVYFAWGLAGRADLADAEALGYIWGRTRRVGEIGASPFSPKIGIVCLRTGRTGAGVWQAERRDVEADYRTYFKKAPPGPVTAIAILTDTDQTQGRAEAWYGPITLEVRP